MMHVFFLRNSFCPNISVPFYHQTPIATSGPPNYLCLIQSWSSAAWRFLLASGNNFLLTPDAVTLYFEEQQYGHLGGDEHILPRIYLRDLLMESLATLGIIDIGYCYPHQLWPDLEGGWGTDEMNFCSRYDGLLYVQLDALGTYCLNVASDYYCIVKGFVTYL
jgi:hypothetical protein